ncbi:hypothetical protein V5O48_004960 [Marasmius crinis-equi]|uniref:Alpha/beta hydrolase fold-3 domain-containing protein n=1 Tax=Marasmius crinis-equi TaxID=585013 RepID=A0ABR3FNM1_9AGAR
MAEYSHLSEIDPELAPLLSSIPPFVFDENTSIEMVRQGYQYFTTQVLQRNWEPLLPESSEYTVNDHQIDVGEGATVLARHIAPTSRKGEEDTFPLLFWVHGGGFIMGDVVMDDSKLRIASVKLRISIVNCEYRLAPEYPFPAAVNDLTAALKYVASNPRTFSASLKKGFVIGGASSGGNLAAVLAFLARDDDFYKDKPLTGQMLHVPTVCHHQAYPDRHKSSLLSLEQNKDAPQITKDMLVRFAELYKGSPTDPRVSPLLLPTHRGLPPAFVQVCGLDPLRDEGLLYEKVLKEAGVPTKLEVYPGVSHGFENPFFHIRQAAKLREDFHLGLQWLLDGAQPIA